MAAEAAAASVSERSYLGECRWGYTHRNLFWESNLGKSTSLGECAGSTGWHFLHGIPMLVASMWSLASRLGEISHQSHHRKRSWRRRERDDFALLCSQRGTAVMVSATSTKLDCPQCSTLLERKRCGGGNISTLKLGASTWAGEGYDVEHNAVKMGVRCVKRGGQW